MNIHLVRRRTACRSTTGGLLLAALLVMPPGMSAGREGPDFRRLPESAWQGLDAAQGIAVGGKKGVIPNIQVIFDANCPWCARLFLKMKRLHSDVAVRWVPIAYFWKSSGSKAASILRSESPRLTLGRNFENYDFDRDRGGVAAESGDIELPLANKRLQKQWLEWGGYTPMVIFRGRDGSILMVGGAEDWIVDAVLARARPSLPPYATEQEERRL